METKIEKILDKFYDYAQPKVHDIRVLSESPELGIVCLRWRDQDRTVTVKAIFQEELVLTELR